MQKFVLSILLLITFCACKKSIPPPDAIKLKLYTTTTINATTNQPEPIYYYARFMQPDGLYYYATTKKTTDFKGIKFTFSLEVPKEIKSASQVEEVVVLISNLEGDVIKDLK